MGRGGGGLALAAAAGGVVALALAAPANAKSAYALPYAAPDVWAAAVRYLRVDRGFTIREKDEKAGYVLFDFIEAGRTFHAALELVALTDDDGRSSTEAVLNMPDLPQRYELVLLDQLGAKVRQERGAPPPAKPRPAPAAPPKDKDAAKPRPEPDGGLPRAPTILVP